MISKVTQIRQVSCSVSWLLNNLKCIGQNFICHSSDFFQWVIAIFKVYITVINQLLNCKKLFGNSENINPSHTSLSHDFWELLYWLSLKDDRLNEILCIKLIIGGKPDNDNALFFSSTERVLHRLFCIASASFGILYNKNPYRRLNQKKKRDNFILILLCFIWIRRIWPGGEIKILAFIKNYARSLFIRCGQIKDHPFLASPISPATAISEIKMKMNGQRSISAEDFFLN